MEAEDRTEAFDLLGIALTEYYQGLGPDNIMVCSSLWDQQATPLKIFFREFSEMPAWERRAMQNCRGRILDVGAGAGAHALHLQAEGHEVVALELSDKLCELMALRGIEKIVGGSIYDFSDEEGFDTILLLMNGVGIARTLSQLPQLLIRLRSLMKKGGQILLDSTDILYMYEEDDGAVWINLNADYYGQVDMWMEYKGIRSEPTTWLYADAASLEEAASEAGLQTEILLKDPGGQYLARLFC